MRTVFALIAAVAAVWLPASSVMACSCAMTTLPEAVGEADVAFVGSLVERVPGGDNFGFPPEDEWRWRVESSRDPGLDSEVAVVAALEDGANCGVQFALGERWLILAHAADGRLQTNGCVPNRRMDAADAEAEALVAVFAPVAADPESGPPLQWPAPVLVIGLTSGVLVVVGLLAFRRTRVS